MNFKTLVTDQGYANMPFGVRLASVMTGAVSSDYRFALPARRPSKVLALLNTLMATIVKWHEARDTVRQLKALDNRLLMDIGIQRADIDALARGWK